MKLTFLLLTVALLNVHATGLSQTVSFSGKDAQLKTIFSAIKKQTGYVVFYDNALLKKTHPVTVSLKDVGVEELLSATLRGQGLSFIIVEKTISIKKQPVFSFFGLEKPLPPPVAVTGRVTDAEGVPLPGVTVLVKDTRTAAITNEAGEFKLSVNQGTTIIFSYIGFEKEEVIINGQNRIEVKLRRAANQALDELVVIGYGTVRKSDLTGAVSSIKGDAIATRKTTQVSQALQGAMPGVMVTRNNNAPGATAQIRVRGITTITDAGANPLIILDGVPVDDINAINPNDIDNISVLKDAASASIYGSRAAAGVILVTTKRAKNGQLNLDYTFEYGLEKPTKLPDYVDVVRFMQLTNELRWNDNGNNANEYPTYTKDVVDNYRQLNADNPDQYPDTDWRGLILNNTAPRQSHMLSISGAGKAIRSRVSLGYDKTDALYDGRTYERLTARVNNDITITKYLSASVDLNFKRSTVKQPYTDHDPNNKTYDPMYKMGIIPPVYAAMWSDGRIGAGKDGANVYALMKNGGFSNDWYNQIGGKIGLDFTPIEGLKISGIISPSMNFDKGKWFNKKIPYTSFNNPNSVSGYIEGAFATRLNEVRNDNYRYTTQFIANYTKQFKNHNINLMGGYEYFHAFDEELTAARSQYILNKYPYLNLGPLEYRDNSGKAYENAYRSWFGRVMYNYKDKYLLQGNIRYDASSRFAPGYRWGSFPSFSAGWVVSEEAFLKKTASWLSFLKLRASWGSLGNERIKGNYPYQSILSFENNSLFYQGNNVLSAQSAAQFQYAIRDISWETTQSYDIGADINFLDNRLRFTGDYYKKTTRDILLELEIPKFIGFDNPFQNTGKMYTHGWDLQLGWNDRVNDFTYNVSVNLSDFKSKMGYLGGTEFLGDMIKKEGSEFNEWYGYVSDGIYQTQDEVDKSAKLNANVKPGDVRFKDVSGPDGVPDGKISPEYDRVLLGGSLPRYMYGGSLQVGYKNWDLGVVLQGVGKQNARLTPDIVQPLRENYGTFPAILDGNTWSKYNTDEQNMKATFPRYSNTSAGNNYAMSDYWLINGSYFRLKNISLGYNLPKHITGKVKVQDIRIYSTVSDVWSRHHFPKGWDPEMNYLGYPITTTFVFGASVKF
ncbi:TonB-dependent receptor [Chitinophaga sp. MM2321]|uniref:TonB-dependent receptor n=1 Tax=Chitinophaga sp. MM2321 TaxID=3137178 RepID=UPI0032D588F9